jgi:hypothetical protein
MATEGGCLCGAVRFRTEAAPMRARTCWCRLCQALGAGSATVNVCFPTAGFVVEGATADYVSTADSGSTMHRRFCPKCGTSLFSEAEQRPHLIFVRAGALDDREVAAPIETIWTSEAPSWAVFDPAIPQVERQPPPL